MRRISPALAVLALAGCPSDGQFGSRSDVVTARVSSLDGSAHVLPGDPVRLELFGSGGQSIDAVWVSCGVAVFGSCTRGTLGVSVPYCGDGPAIVDGVVRPCVAGFGAVREFMLPPVLEEGPIFTSIQFEVWYRPDGGDVRRCVDERVHGCSALLVRAEFGPSYALALRAMAAQGEVQPPPEAYDEELQAAEPNRHPEVAGVEIGGDVMGSGSVVEWDGALTLTASVDEPEAYPLATFGENGSLVAEPSIEIYTVTWIVNRESGSRIVTGPVLQVEEPGDSPEPTVVDVMVEDSRGGVGVAWVELR